MVSRRARAAVVQGQLFSADIGPAFVCRPDPASCWQTAREVGERSPARTVVAMALRAPRKNRRPASPPISDSRNRSLADGRVALMSAGAGTSLACVVITKNEEENIQ